MQLGLELFFFFKVPCVIGINNEMALCKCSAECVGCKCGSVFFHFLHQLWGVCVCV